MGNEMMERLWDGNEIVLPVKWTQRVVMKSS